MIKLYSFGSHFGVMDPSPFVLKVDAYMRMAGLEYECLADVSNLKVAPKGKLPYITDDEKTIADSEFIIRYLQEKFQLKLDINLSDEEKALAYLLGKSLDENLYWCLVYARWARDDTWVHIKKAFFSSMPFPLNLIVPPIARRDVMSSLKKQGLGRHSNEEIKTIAQQTFDSLSVVLGEKAYFFGNTPSTFDATAFGFLSQFINVSLNDEFNDLARHYDNLVDYCNNIRSLYY